ncbi:GFA family protein [Gilliamella intestini]|uniref:Uncharacterized conserved protein n=1 Tax=Gilliamella intestini TaxID=1798183 RepID=A0A1C4ADJ0_9GAMM|nr:GFA family protein [Gilliamella intestini]SCB92742.1 Uncharacterized conserved protein [Gilliamella intestini]
MSIQYHGSCLCGKVKLTVPFENAHLSACHCQTCRKWNAGPLMALAHNGEINIEGQINITHYNSSQWAERAFCKECGTHLYYHLKGTQHYYIAAWLFDDIKQLEFTTQAFIDKKPSCYDFANHTHNMTEADIWAKAAKNSSES